MTYGIDVWDRSGKKVFENSDISGRIVWQLKWSGVVSGSKVLPEIAGKKTFEFSSSGAATPFGGLIVSRNGTTISWSVWAGSWQPEFDSGVITVIIYN